MASNKRKKKDSGSSVGIANIILPTALGVAATVILAVLAILIFGKLAYGTENPSDYAGIIGLSALYISVFAGGLVAAVSGGKSFTATIFHAVLVTLIMIIVEMAAGALSTENVILKILVPPCSLLGGAVCFLKAPKKRKPKFKERAK